MSIAEDAYDTGPAYTFCARAGKLKRLVRNKSETTVHVASEAKSNPLDESLEAFMIPPPLCVCDADDMPSPVCGSVRIDSCV